MYDQYTAGAADVDLVELPVGPASAHRGVSQGL
jgi:hypothetical protein